MVQLKNTNQINSHNNISLEVYLQFISEINPINTEKEVELIRRVNENDNSAFEKLVKVNLWLVVSIAKEYQNMGLSLRDLIQEGNLGLISAAKGLINSKKFNFTAYAIGWIRQSILQAITEHFWISRLSLNKNGYKNKMDNVLHQLNRNFLSEPIIDELSDELKLQTKIKYTSKI
jgi:RNA polymerase primary sigma factor